MSKNNEESKTLDLDFKKLKKVAGIESDVLPVVIQDIDSKDVLIVGYMNQLAFDKSVQTNKVVFWSTSRNELWEKGQRSGSELLIRSIYVNCEQNSLLIMVELKGSGSCHTKVIRDGEASLDYRKSCYYRRIGANQELAFVSN